MAEKTKGSAPASSANGGEYKPRFAAPYLVLKEHYEKALVIGAVDADEWCRRTLSLMEGFRAAAATHVLPPIFSKYFGDDIDNIRRTVEKRLNGNRQRASDEQKRLMTEMADYQDECSLGR